MEAASPALHPHALDGSGHEGPRVPPRPRVQEGDARADPRGSGPRQLGRPLSNTFESRFSPAALLTAGLVLERQDKSGHYDRFRERAVFPILNEGGKVVAFGARSLDGSEPKYLNSPETPVYSKSRTLYGLSWAKDAIRQRGPDRADGGLPRRGPGPRGRGGDRGGHLRHRPHVVPRPAPAPLRREDRGELRPGRGGAEGGAEEPRRAASRRACACTWWSCPRATIPTRS